MLEVKNVSKQYWKQDVLKGVSLLVKPEIKVVIGLNGSGKSTLLKIIAGILSADTGNIFINGRDVSLLPPEHRHVGYVPQHPALFDRMNVQANIKYGLRNGRGSEEFLHKIVNMLELEEILDKKPGELSGGYKSRVSLARALAPQPQVMLLDEPLSDIDAAIKEKILKEFRKVLKLLQIPVVYVTHDIQEAKQLGDTFAVINGGRISEAVSAANAFDMIKNTGSTKK